MSAPQTKVCPLCGDQGPAPFHEDRQRPYMRCVSCRLVFVPSNYWLDATAEKAVYDLHRNDPEDAGYRRFLSRLSSPLVEKLPRCQQGLDFGCGPGPALARLLEAHGHEVALFDPYYANDRALLERRYGFITATEVVEHLRSPGAVFRRLFGMLQPGGWLGIMTKLVIDRDSFASEAFARWHYIRDPTHICFYSLDTFEYLARRFSAAVEFIGQDVTLLQKRP